MCINRYVTHANVRARLFAYVYVRVCVQRKGLEGWEAVSTKCCICFLLVGMCVWTISVLVLADVNTKHISIVYLPDQASLEYVRHWNRQTTGPLKHKMSMADHTCTKVLFFLYNMKYKNIFATVLTWISKWKFNVC